MVPDHQEDYASVSAASQAVAKQFGLGRETVRRWVVQADIDADGRPGLSSAEHAEIKRLKAETGDCATWRSCARPRLSSRKLDNLGR
jgi:transposase